MNEKSYKLKRTSTRASASRLYLIEDTKKYWAKLRIFATVIGKFMMVKKNIYLFGMNYVKQQTADNRADNQKRMKCKVAVFRPDCMILKVWHVLTFLLLVYTSIVVPLNLSFPEIFGVNWMIADTFIDFVFILDIFVTLNTSFYKEKGEWVTERTEIFKRYLKGWFLVDLLSSLPFQLLDGGDTSNKFLKLTRMKRIYKIASLVKFLRFTKVSHKSFKILMFKRFYDIDMLTFLLMTFILVHNLACLWILVSSIEDLTYSNMSNRYSFEDLNTFDIYLHSVYYIFTTLTTIGYGDIIPQTNEEKIFALLVMAFGIGFYSVLIARLGRILTSIDSRVSAVNSKVKYFNDFAKEINLSDTLQLKVRNHIILNSYKHYYIVSEIDFLKHIPLIMREEVSKYLHSALIGKIDFLRDKNSNFLHEFVPRLKKSHFLKNEVIYYIGEQPEEIYFIDKGQVGLKLEQLVFRIYHQGSYFGEIEIIEDTLRSNTAFSFSQELEAFILMKKDYFSMRDTFPEVFNQIVECAKTKKMKNEEALNKSSYPLFKDLLVESSSELSALSGSKDPARHPRRDTEVVISVKNDNQNKKRNRALWSEAVEGNCRGSIYLKAKTLKKSLSLIDGMLIELPENKKKEETFKKVKKAIFKKHEQQLDTTIRNNRIWMYDRLFLSALLQPLENKIVEDVFEQFQKTELVEISIDKMKTKAFRLADTQKTIQSRLCRLNLRLQNHEDNELEKP